MKNEQELKIKILLCNKDDKNGFCVDCGAKSMDYASINNGVIICSKCAEEHEKLGHQISFLHKLSNKWDDYLFNYMNAGGNSRFLQFCKDYKLLDKNLDIINKYKSKGCCYYREIIHSEVMGYDPPDNININTAYELENEIEDNYPEFENYAYVKHVDPNNTKKEFYTRKEKKEEEESGILNSLGNMFGFVKQKVNEGTDELMNKVSEMNIKEKMFGGSINYIDYFFGDNKEKEKNEEEENNNEDIKKDEGKNKTEKKEEDNNNFSFNFFNVFGIKENKNEEKREDIPKKIEKEENDITNLRLNKQEEQFKNEINEKNNNEETKINEIANENKINKNKEADENDKKARVAEDKIENENIEQNPEIKKANVENIINEINCENEINDEEKDELEKILNQ